MGGVYSEKCENGEVVKDPNPCEVDGRLFCHKDVVDEKVCNAEVGWSKKAHNLLPPYHVLRI